MAEATTTELFLRLIVTASAPPDKFIEKSTVLPAFTQNLAYAFSVVPTVTAFAFE
jgi:hypothetical protein